jgi:hypothetical protein
MTDLLVRVLSRGFRHATDLGICNDIRNCELEVPGPPRDGLRLIDDVDASSNLRGRIRRPPEWAGDPRSCQKMLQKIAIKKQNPIASHLPLPPIRMPAMSFSDFIRLPDTGLDEDHVADLVHQILCF